MTLRDLLRVGEKELAGIGLGAVPGQSLCGFHIKLGVKQILKFGANGLKAGRAHVGHIVADHVHVFLESHQTGDAGVKGTIQNAISHLSPRLKQTSTYYFHTNPAKSQGGL